MKEQDIRPQDLLERYVELSAKDASKYFNDNDRRNMPCVACGVKDVTHQFNKYGFDFSECSNCKTLFQTPRPSIESFEQFYRDSESSNYWAEVFFPAVAEIRRDKLVKPKVKDLSLLCLNIGLEVNKIIDVGAGYGVFLDEWRKLYPSSELVAVEPSTPLAEECRKKNINVIESMAEQVSGLDDFADLVVCFEVLEHVYDPLDFIFTLKRMARKGGYIFISTLCIDGFDLQLLWDKSSQISPPHHINFISVKGFELLFKRAGLIDIQVLTPGKLDVDIVQNQIKKNPDLISNDAFLQKILNAKDKSKEFQNFLANNQLSSHAWVIGKVANEL
jgi:2-polyprenyl-3-methyl-5-hydroxy-6-metoxy-1,4-benzoquinol methylase